MKSILIKILLPFIVFFGISGHAWANAQLPTDIKWITNDTAKVFASPDARKGGTYRTFISNFPLTLRQVGPDSNGSFRSVIGANQMHLMDSHPDTEELLPALATHWAFGKDKKSMYFKLNPKARWSDGKPLIADDFLFGLEFMRSKFIMSPWHNNFFKTDFDKVVKYDDHTISIHTTRAHPEIEVYTNSLPAIPRHYYRKLDKNFVRKYNWKVIPNTGPYQISKVRKGKSIMLTRKKNWWAKDLKYMKGRFNVDRVKYIVIRDLTTAFEYFLKARLDVFSLTLPEYWHQKTPNLKKFKKGYIERIWFYTDDREPSIGFYLNQDKAVFKDVRVRYAFAHAIHIDKLINGLLRGDYQRLQSGTIGYGPYTNTAVKARTYNIKKVEQLMTAAGWKRGKGGIWEKGKQRYSVTITYSADHHTQRLVLLKEEARKAGIELNLQRLDGSAAFKRFLEKKHEVAWMGWSTSFRPQFWGQYHSDNAHKPQTNNITNTDDPELDKMIMAYRESLSIKERIQLAKKIQSKIHKIGSYIPAYRVGYFREGYWRWWKFPKVPATRRSDSLFDPFGTATFWLDKDEKKKTKEAMDDGIAYPAVTKIDTTYKRDR